MVCLVEWVAWVEWVEWECKNPNPIKYSKRAVFTALFFAPLNRCNNVFTMYVQCTLLRCFLISFKKHNIEFKVQNDTLSYGFSNFN